VRKPRRLAGLYVKLDAQDRAVFGRYQGCNELSPSFLYDEFVSPVGTALD
jgi:hypothetical protein